MLDKKNGVKSFSFMTILVISLPDNLSSCHMRNNKNTL